MNHLAKSRRLHNQYILLRHGRSEANDKRLIISRPDEGIAAYGLTTKGKAQVVASITKAQTKDWLDKNTIIYTSDFKRCVETAEIAKSALHANHSIVVSPCLRERYFGRFDNKSVYNLGRVFLNDIGRRKSNPHAVEPVDSVVDRATQLILELESKYKGKTILLVAHGDLLQIMQASFESLNLAQHLILRHWQTAEIRRLPRKLIEPLG
jgi:glucosyl-3-phosphoglycerate phosphatase